MDDEEIVGPTLPHSSFGAPDCCGYLNGIIRGDRADIVCNECDKVVRTVPTADLQRTLDAMELSVDVTTVKCPHCETVHISPTSSLELIAYMCKKCGNVVKLRDDPNRQAFLRKRVIPKNNGDGHPVWAENSSRVVTHRHGGNNSAGHQFAFVE
jgi:hypothetical protein